ncbi:hypothetical protein [Leucobacter luti]|uniref:Uncharacterized protein n=1 Tax=Leucobacter luti TaxID=340320 RepID=A0A4Q7U519_9MICO|nr:hypothetical protein [Leucobacter luti]MBL3701044.1 hypothetical protein [Leucobacter luti]RZT68734.1 hypothetical protein EV139_0461 [Leucobacter luti]
MTATSVTHQRGRRASRGRAVAILALAALVPLAGLVASPAPALAAAPQRVTAEATVGTDRVVSVAVACTSAKACAGKLSLKLATGGTKTLKYSVAARGAKTLNWKLGTADYRAFVKRGSAKLKISGATTKPSSAKFTQSATLKPAKAQVKVTTASYTVESNRVLPLRLSCAAAAGCAGTAKLQLGGKTLVQGKVQAKKGATTVKLTLTAAQAAKLTTTAAKYTVSLTETKPDAIAHTATITLRKPTPAPEPEPEAPVRGASKAYAERNWVPSAVDTCPAELHASYQTVGPDGKIYPTWHPAQVTDPATGELCSFGHEHGADPSTSEIFDWVAAFYAPDDLVAGEPVGLPFGYTSEELENYGHEHGGMAMRHEDNAGHKVFVANNVKMLDAHRNWLRLADGSQLVCDVLIKQHQGSWSPDATSNNAHESEFAARCTDGTEIITSILTRFGNANEMFGTCAPDTAIPTVGSLLPAGDGGRRIIPTTDCVRNNPTDWTLYELWESDSKIVSADGTVFAAFDPWFGIRNPSRLYDATASTATANGISRPLDLAWYAERPATDYLWAGLSDTERFDYTDPRSPFNGAQRDFYLGELTLAQVPTADGTIYSDPYGGGARTDRTVGAIRQHIVPGSVLGDVSLSRQKFDAKADFGSNNGVHAPN